jgi:hypothetical protein
MHFSTKIYLKSTRNHTAKHAVNISKFSRNWCQEPLINYT